MDREILKEYFIDKNDKKRQISPICVLSETHLRELTNGSGNAKDEYKFIDSSTALGVNFFLLYEKLHPKAQVTFEWDKCSPLKVGGKSNLDVRLAENDKIIFFESKFLEPYYMSNSRFTESYFIKENYCDHWKFTEDDLATILRGLQSVTYYNASQLFRHLLAIVNHIVRNKSEYEKVSIVELNSISWDMDTSFVERLNLSPRSKSYAIKRMKILKEEEKIVNEMLNGFIKDYVSDIIPKNLTLSFQTTKYNDVVDLIDNNNVFKERYFIR